jgi:hypothetical protein
MGAGTQWECVGSAAAAWRDMQHAGGAPNRRVRGAGGVNRLAQLLSEVAQHTITCGVDHPAAAAPRPGKKAGGAKEAITARPPPSARLSAAAATHGPDVLPTTAAMPHPPTNTPIPLPPPHTHLPQGHQNVIQVIEVLHQQDPRRGGRGVAGSAGARFGWGARWAGRVRGLLGGRDGGGIGLWLKGEPRGIVHPMGHGRARAALNAGCRAGRAPPAAGAPAAAPPEHLLLEQLLLRHLAPVAEVQPAADGERQQGQRHARAHDLGGEGGRRNRDVMQRDVSARAIGVLCALLLSRPLG